MNEVHKAKKKEGALAVFVQMRKCAHTVTPEPYLQSYCSIFPLVGFFIGLDLLLCEPG